MEMCNRIEWPGSVESARELQLSLAKRVRLTEFKQSINFVAGIDVAFPVGGKVTRAAVVVLSFPEMKVLEQVTVEQQTCLPYIPGMLSFREGSAILQALERLSIQPDILMFDGQGILHPQRLGIASHIGVLLNKPTLGVAKNPFRGSFIAPKTEFGAYESVYLDEEHLGYALRSKKNVKPIFVSPGHLITKQQALTLAVQCCHGYKLPEPTRLADKLSGYQPS